MLAHLERRPFGATGLTVSALGLGAGRIGGDDLDDDDADALLGAAIDAGVTLVDTARSYGRSEERIGRALAGRRDGVVLATKGGYGIPGVPDWTGAVISAGVDAALRALRTDRIDVFFLRSCPVGTLERGEVVGALADAVRAGKVRVMGYSGEGEALAWAVRFGALRGRRDEREPLRSARDRRGAARRGGGRDGRRRQATAGQRAVAVRFAPVRGLRRALLGALAGDGHRSG